MVTKLYDLAVITGSYNGRDGKKHNNYKNIGAIMQDDKGGKYIMLDACFNPAGVPRKEGSSNITVRLFTPKDKEQNNSYNSNSYKQSSPPDDWGQNYNNSNDDNIPF